MKQRINIGIVLKGQRLRFAVVLICVALSSLLALMPQQVMRFTIDYVLGGNADSMPSYVLNAAEAVGGRDWLASNLWVCAAVLLGIALVNGAFAYLRGSLSAKASENMAESLRNRI